MSQKEQLEHVRSVLARHRERLTGEYGAVGSGIGREGDRYVIVLYLESPREDDTEPPDVEGVPVRLEVTGRFRRLDDQPDEPPP